MDIIGLIPIFIGMTGGMEKRNVSRITMHAVTAGFIVSIAFIFLGKFLFKAIGITINDFRVAGGLLLLVFAVNDLLFSSEARKTPSASMGIVPIGIPLLVGPAVLTILLLSADNYGYINTISSLAANLAIAWIGFHFSDRIISVLGEGGSRGIAKVASLLLASIGVMMIRIGIEEMLK